MAMLHSQSFDDTDPVFDPIIPQRNIYRWYDERYSDDAFDIYSPEWGSKLVYWEINSPAIKIDDAQNELDIGTFFRSDPVAAFSLWKLLQVCYDLDEAVCGATTDRETMASWKTYRPFEYLGSKEVRREWSRSLEKLRNRIKDSDEESNDHTETWEARMWEILQAVEKFEEAFAVLEENFKANLADNRKCAEWMENRISDEMGMRFSLITNLLEIKDGEFADQDLEDQEGSVMSSRPGSLRPESPRETEMGINRYHNQQSLRQDPLDVQEIPGFQIPKSPLRNTAFAGTDPRGTVEWRESKLLRTGHTPKKRRKSVQERHKHRFLDFKRLFRWRQKSSVTEETSPLDDQEIRDVGHMV